MKIERGVDEILEDLDTTLDDLIAVSVGHKVLEAICDKLEILRDELCSGVLFEVDFDADEETEH